MHKIYDCSEMESRCVTGIAIGVLNEIRMFLLGTVYGWCNTRPTNGFTARELVGENNRDWSATPLQAVYQKHINAGKSDQAAFDAAAKDIGWLLLSTLQMQEANGGRKFICTKEWKSNKYFWVSEQFQAFHPELFDDNSGEEVSNA